MAKMARAAHLTIKGWIELKGEALDVHIQPLLDGVA